MNRILWTALVLFVLFSTTSAKGIFDLVTIEGEALDAPIEVHDSPQLEALSMTQLMVIFESIPAPSDAGAGYTLTRYGWSGEAYIPFDRVVYYPNPADSEPVVYYEGLVNGSSEYDGRWFQAAPAGDEMMRQILTDHGITVSGVGVTIPPLIEEIGFGDYYIHQILRDNHGCHVAAHREATLFEKRYAAYAVACSGSHHFLLYRYDSEPIPWLYSATSY